MYSVLRIGGVDSQLQKLLKVMVQECPELDPEINSTNMLVANLSMAKRTEHWVEVAEALNKVARLINNAAIGDIGLLVDTAFEKRHLPEGGVAIESLSVSHMALEAMSKIGADFEATVYPVDDSNK